MLVQSCWFEIVWFNPVTSILSWFSLVLVGSIVQYFPYLLLDPLQCHSLIPESQVSGREGTSSGEETENPKSVVEGAQNDVLVHPEVRAKGAWGAV